MPALQVVSDIDDTLMCSGGAWPAGRDMRYPRKCMYPGALALYSELDIGYCTRLQVTPPMTLFTHSWSLATAHIFRLPPSVTVFTLN